MIVAFQTQAACGAEANSICQYVYNKTGNEVAGDIAAWLSARLSAILITLVLAYVITRILRRRAPDAEEAWISRRTDEARRLRPGDLSPYQVTLAELHIERTRQRAHTLRLVLTSLISAVIWTIALLVILDQMGLNLAPLIAGAGVVGLALGFGAQTMVRDFLAGIFIVLEDQYGIGDVVDLGSAKGAVEQVNLRSTRLRDVSGVVWYVPNGEITRVANMSQLWSKAVIDISVGYESDLDAAGELLKETADAMWRDTIEGTKIIEEPIYQGVERFEADGIALRLVIKTEPNEQWAAARELRRRIKIALDGAGIEIPYPQRTIRTRAE